MKQNLVQLEAQSLIW